MLRDSEGSGPELILMGTGSEVHQAHEAFKILDGEGIHVRAQEEGGTRPKGGETRGLHGSVSFRG